MFTIQTKTKWKELRELDRRLDKLNIDLDGGPTERLIVDAWSVAIPAVLVIIAMLIFVIIFFCKPVHAEENEPVMICDAIFHAEGGAKAQYLYGIRSVHYENIVEARKICIRTVRHSHQRWEKAGRPGAFLQFLSQSYCPVGASNDPRGLNKHWLANVRYWIRKDAYEPK